ncbi:hypothetical protein JKF63_03736 [Porcisia hertigi]|uniref:non-specific serine/threonine protein kinase n=1 Tax=Porcisia hertigi TaxID=2761500 RepID=A0A836IBQ0_9TRYP|nr:hypothetical protein JKF63_03736 [Porcisia hertigi]
MLTDSACRRMRVVSFLGCGAFGDAYLVRNAGDTCSVVKRSKSVVRRSGFLEEYLGMMNLCSLNVVASRDAWIDHESRLCISMEYCDAGDLGQYLEKRYPLLEEELLSIVVQLLLGLDHIHKRNRLHRDIKPENIFLLSANESDRRWPTVKLGDFGLVKRLSHYGARVVSHVGTPLYLAPEIMEGYAYTSKADVWSMGLVVYRLMVNKLPFPASSVDAFTRQVLSGCPPHPSTLSGYSRALGDCVLTMLSRNWKRRPSAQDLLGCSVFQPTLVQHPWIRAPSHALPCMFVPRRVPPVAVYTAPSESAKILRTLEFGDQVYLSLLSPTGYSPRGLWLEVLHPFSGFIRDCEKPGSLFESYVSEKYTVGVRSPN